MDILQQELAKLDGKKAELEKKHGEFMCQLAGTYLRVRYAINPEMAADAAADLVFMILEEKGIDPDSFLPVVKDVDAMTTEGTQNVITNIVSLMKLATEKPGGTA